MDEKIKYLKDLGFEPMLDTPENTLYMKGAYIVSVDDYETIYDLMKDMDSLGMKKPKEYPEVKEEAPAQEEVVIQKEAPAQAEAPVEEPEKEETNPTEEAKEEPCPAEEPAEGDSPEPETEGDVEPSGDEEENPFVDHSENVDAFYLADVVKNTPTPLFRRLTLGGNRYYYRTMEDGSVKIYASATNLIKDGYADNKDGLNEWKMQIKFLGQNPEEVSKYEADKGTIMHYLFDLFLIGRDIYLRKSFLRKTLLNSDIRISKENMERFLNSDDDMENMMERLRRFAKFCSDYKVVPIMIEKILSYDEYNVASPIDLVCQMTVTETVEGFFGETYKRDGAGFKKGDPKKSKKTVERSFYAIVDFKSGGIYSSHSLQLELYRRAVKQWYGDLIPIEKIYNFSPKSESSKEYTLRDQTECKELRKADAVYAQGMINHENKDKTFKAIHGCLNINKEYKLEDYVVTYDIAEELRKLNG